MKKLILLILAGIALFAFIFSTSVLWYNFFYNDVSSTNTVSSLEIRLDNQNNTINEDGLIPLDDETAKNLKPYSFEVENTNSVATTYNVIIEDAMISDDASYSSKELLSRDQLNYQLSLNGKVIKTGKLSDIDNNILDTRNISGNVINNYELRIYVSEDAVNTDWQNKYYHFNVNVQMEVE